MISPATESANLHAFGEEIWRGSSHAWESDEMGHQNVRFYISQALGGVAELLARHGVPTLPTAGQKVTTRTQHIRLLHEIRAGTPLHLRGAITRVEGNFVEVATLLFHSDTGTLAAAIVTGLEPAEWDSDRAMWPEALRSAVPATLPQICEPRSLHRDLLPPSQIDLAQADALGLDIAAMGIIDDAMCDHFGRLRTQAFVARVSDGTRLVTNSFHAAAAAAPGVPASIGSAGVECRLHYFRYPRAGDRFVIRAGLAEVTDRIRRTIYWMLDPSTGRACATLDSIELLLDLDARRAFRLPADAVEMFQPRVVDFTRAALS